MAAGQPLRIGILTDDFYPHSGGVTRSIEQQIDHLVEHLHRNPIVTDAHGAGHALLTHEAEQHHALVLRSLFQSEAVVLLPIVRGGRAYGYLVACDTHGTKHAVRHHRDDVDYLAHLTKLLAYAAELA